VERNCDICRTARAGNGEEAWAIRSSLVVTADGEGWFLLNASPNPRQQINQTVVLHPRRGRRQPLIASVG